MGREANHCSVMPFPLAVLCFPVVILEEGKNGILNSRKMRNLLWGHCFFSKLEYTNCIYCRLLIFLVCRILLSPLFSIGLIHYLCARSYLNLYLLGWISYFKFSWKVQGQGGRVKSFRRVYLVVEREDQSAFEMATVCISYFTNHVPFNFLK